MSVTDGFFHGHKYPQDGHQIVILARRSTFSGVHALQLPQLVVTMADSVLSTLQNYKADPLPAALVAIGGAVVFKFAWGVSHAWTSNDNYLGSIGVLRPSRVLNP